MSPWPDIGDAPNSGKLRVLVVDDEPTLRLGFAYALSDRTTAVETAATGHEALEKLAAAHFDAIILDLRMPELDGIGVIDALRSTGNKVPVVLCSAALHPNAALRAIRLGVVDFLLKPVRPADLRQVIRFVIQPESYPFSQAMKAARSGDLDLAVTILTQIISPDRQAQFWLGVIKSIVEHDTQGDHGDIEEKVRTSLSVLAFNSPMIS